MDMYQVGNNILLKLRCTPLTGNDFRLIKSGLKIIDTYLTKNSISTLSSKLSNPNIIIIQLESFFDLTFINGVKFNIDPIPNFIHLKENYSTSSFSVSTIGGGTANTKFETISGMNLDFFGPGEYPYNTILKIKAINSINYTLN